MGDPNRILIRDFDATYQAKLWIDSSEKDLKEKNEGKLHNQEAQEVMKAILRATLLLSGEITLFYSEVFDGIFLMEWGPDEVAKFLGYSGADEMPITIIGPTNDDEEIERNAANLKNSTRHCKCGRNEESNLDQWMYGERSIDSDSMDNAKYEVWYKEKSNAWLRAIRGGKVNLVNWSSDIDHVEASFDLKEPITESIKKIGKLPLEITRLMNMVLNIPTERITNKEECVLFAERINHNLEKDFYDKCNRQEILINEQEIEDKRASVLYFIDQLNEELITKHLVYWWWNKQYMIAIANKYHASYLSFHAEFNFTELGNMESYSNYNVEEVSTKLGLKYKEISNWDLQLQNLSAMFNSTARKDLLISGNILDDIMELTPDTFLQLKNNMERPHLKTNKISAAKIYDISLMISNTIDIATTYRNRLKNAARKLIFIIVTSTIISLFDFEILEKKGVHFYLWGITLLLVTLPWDEINEMLSLRKCRLSASIRVYDGEKV